MRSWDALPDHPLEPSGALGRELMANAIVDYRAAARHLHRLPYGRNANRGDYRCVLEEARGTCSTKHAYLAALAGEQGLEVELVVGIYDMREANTPGVGSVLSRHGLASIPEAHCYLRYLGERIDVTRAGVSPTAAIDRFHREWPIEPRQIGEHKLQLHRSYLLAWYQQQASQLVEIEGFEDLWRIREACIEALAQ